MPDLDLEKIMEMAQNAQAELQKAQDNLDNVEVEGAADAARTEFGVGQEELKPVAGIEARDHFGERSLGKIRQPALPGERPTQCGG